MSSNLIVARGGIEFVPPISLAFWRWTFVFIILLPFTYISLKKNYLIIKKEYKKLFFLGAMGCGVCGAFPFLAGATTTVTNMAIIYTSSPCGQTSKLYRFNPTSTSCKKKSFQSL